MRAKKVPMVVMSTLGERAQGGRDPTRRRVLRESPRRLAADSRSIAGRGHHGGGCLDFFRDGGWHLGGQGLGGREGAGQLVALEGLGILRSVLKDAVEEISGIRKALALH